MTLNTLNKRQLCKYIGILLTLSEDSKSDNCSKSSTPQGDEKPEACEVGIFVETCCELWMGGSKLLVSASLVQVEVNATRIPVARNLWWLAERLLAKWIESSQSWQKRALSSTQNIKAALSCQLDDMYEKERLKFEQLSKATSQAHQNSVIQRNIEKAGKLVCLSRNLGRTCSCPISSLTLWMSEVDLKVTKTYIQGANCSRLTIVLCLLNQLDWG